MVSGASTRMALALVGATLLGCGSSGRDRPPAADGGGVDAGVDGGAPGVDGGGPAGRVPESEHAAVVARAWCEHEVECDCLTIDADVDACIARVTEMLERRAELARGMGLTYDDRCAGEILREIDVRGCSAYGYPVAVGCEACELYYGTLAEGETCELIVASGVSVCAQGLLCLRADGATESTCQEPCEAFNFNFVGIGEACDPAGVEARCEPLEAFCNADAICEAFPVLGEACPLGECSGDAYCDPETDTCEPRVDRGAACTSGIECNTLSCDDAVCTSFCWPPSFF